MSCPVTPNLETTCFSIASPQGSMHRMCVSHRHSARDTDPGSDVGTLQHHVPYFGVDTGPNVLQRVNDTQQQWLIAHYIRASARIADSQNFQLASRSTMKLNLIYLSVITALASAAAIPDISDDLAARDNHSPVAPREDHTPRKYGVNTAEIESEIDRAEREREYLLSRGKKAQAQRKAEYIAELRAMLEAYTMNTRKPLPWPFNGKRDRFTDYADAMRDKMEELNEEYRKMAEKIRQQIADLEATGWRRDLSHLEDRDDYADSAAHEARDMPNLDNVKRDITITVEELARQIAEEEDQLQKLMKKGDRAAITRKRKRIAKLRNMMQAIIDLDQSLAPPMGKRSVGEPENLVERDYADSAAHEARDDVPDLAARGRYSADIAKLQVQIMKEEELLDRLGSMGETAAVARKQRYINTLKARLRRLINANGGGKRSVDDFDAIEVARMG